MPRILNTQVPDDPDAIHSTPFFRYTKTVESDRSERIRWSQRSRQTPAVWPSFRCSSMTGPSSTSRQERQIMQSSLNLDDFLPGLTPSVRLAVQRAPWGGPGGHGAGIARPTVIASDCGEERRFPHTGSPLATLLSVGTGRREVLPTTRSVRINFRGNPANRQTSSRPLRSAKSPFPRKGAMSKPLVLDLFAGAGGFALGAVSAGFEVAASVDVDADLLSCHADNFPNASVLNADLLDVAPHEVLEACGRRADEIAGVLGGPPCQGFSRIGHRDRSDPRNRLVGRFFDYVRRIRPRFFAFENVPGILDSSFRDILAKGLSQVDSLYRVVGPTLLDASRFGVPTKRTRVLVFGLRASGSSDFNPTAERPAVQRSVRDAIFDLPTPDTTTVPDENGRYWGRYPENGGLSDYAVLMRRPPPPGLGSECAKLACAKGLVSGLQPTWHTERVTRRFATVPPGRCDHVSRFPRLRWEHLAPTLRAGTGKDRGSYQAARPIHPRDNRVISVREAARIQGFPDWFQFHPTKWHSFRMIGNSISPLMATHLLARVREAIKGQW